MVTILLALRHGILIRGSGDFVDHEETRDAWISAGEVPVSPMATTIGAIPMDSGISNPGGVENSGYEYEVRFDLEDTILVERSSYHSFYIYSDHSDLEIVSHEASGNDHQYPVGGLLTNGADMNLFVGKGSASEFGSLQT